jgi:two-component system chemotaxis sensor kinase CheA
MQRPRLKTYLLASLILVTVTPLGYLGATQVARWRQVQRRDADQELTFAARVLTRAVAQVIDANISALQMSAAEIGAAGSFEPATLRRLARIHKERFPGSVIVVFCDLTGRTIAAEPESLVGPNRNDRGDYREMIRTGRTGISEVELGKASHLPAIHVRTPVRLRAPGGEEVMVGNMGIALDLGLLQKLAAEVVESFGNIQARVLDKRGRLIVESEPEGRVVLRDLSRVAIYGASTSGQVELREGFDDRGTRVRAAVASLEDRGLGWVVALTRSRASIDEQAARARRTTLLAIAGSLVLGLLLALGLAAWLARPITRLASYATRAGAGEAAGPPPPGRWDAREVSTLVDTVHSMFNQLRGRNDDLERFQHTLEARIQERTRELDLRNTEMGLLLDNLHDGVFIMNGAGLMSLEHSARLETWFGPVPEAEAFHRYFGRHSHDFGAEAAVGWDQVMEDVLGIELGLEQLPRTLVAGGRRFAFSYRGIGAPREAEPGVCAPHERYLVVVSDVTLETERENMEREQKETLAIFERLLSDRPGFLSFEEEARAILARVLGPDRGPEALARDLHTLKGNCMLFGIGSVATLCHELESRLLDGDGAGDGAGANAERGLTPEELAPLGQRWERLTADVDRLLGNRRRVIELSPDEHATLEQAVEADVPRTVLARMLREMTLEPVDQRLQHLAAQARQLAARLEKSVVVEVSPGGVRLDRQQWAPFWAAFVHAVRNAVDHGLELPSERRAAGKPDAGHVLLRAARRTDGRGFVVEIADDGRGIDWEGLRAERLAQAGTSPELESEEWLFTAGVSTARSVTDISGRGMGMGALHAAVRQLGGEISVESQRGAGTRIRIAFVDDADLPQRQKVA